MINSLIYYLREYLRDIFDYFKKNKNIKNYNGLNQKYFRYGKGALLSKFYLKNGKKEGVFLSYYNNGQLEEESNWKDGRRTGISKGYFARVFSLSSFRFLTSLFCCLTIKWHML